MTIEKTSQIQPSKKYKSPDKTIRHVWDGKLHSWEGPALIPEGEYKQREYYIYGIQYSEEAWGEAKRDWEGIPFYKTSMAKARN
jgi:hypothetical protein